jgi:hypothetical protein
MFLNILLRAEFWGEFFASKEHIRTSNGCKKKFSDKMSPNSSYVEMILMTRMNQHPPVHHPFEYYYYDSELTTMIS